MAPDRRQYQHLSALPIGSAMIPHSQTLAIVCVLVGSMLAGCGRDEVRSYRVPKLQVPRASTTGTAQPQTADQRLLGVILPADGESWFFKVMGAGPKVSEQKPAFDHFVRSVRATGQHEPPVTWKLPDGWHEHSQPGSQMRYATFHLGRDEEQPLELTVIRASGTVLDNVNRWRDQLGLEPVSEPELNQLTTRLDSGGTTITLVDMTGPGRPKEAPTTPLAPTASAHPHFAETTAADRASLTYATPDGWVKQPNPSGLRAAAFDIRDADRRAEVTAIPLSGEAGGLLANLNRWRDEIGLAPVERGELDKVVQRIDVAGLPAHYAHLVGPDSTDGQREAILTVVLLREDRTWFFKMKGHAELVARQKPAFEQWVRSVRFNGARLGEGEQSD